MEDFDINLLGNLAREIYFFILVRFDVESHLETLLIFKEDTDTAVYAESVSEYLILLLDACLGKLTI